MNVNDYLHARAAAKRVPLSGTFELSPVCNFACKMCYVRKTPEQIRSEGKRLLEHTEWLELAKQCYEAGTLYLLLTGGEPFLYPNFKELYIALHKMGFVLSINTNGTMINEATVAWLKEYAPSRVNVTLYGASAETYRRICGNPEGFTRAMKAISMLQEAGIPVVINCSVIPENQEDLLAIMTIGKERGLNTRVATYMFPPVRREQEQTDSRLSAEVSAELLMRRAKFQLTPGAFAKFLAREDRPAEDASDWGANQGEEMRCRAGRSAFWINWEGTMTACGITRFPRVEYPLQDGFVRCWDRLTDAVRSVTVLSGCSGCPKRDVCNPCVAMLEAETGDVNTAAPYLCRMADHVLELIEKEREETKNG
ncbi:MAG: radical SAM protein [Oscillospiraceae bacterium]|nr:radical SAM protein [Oscillospiraceae bacterium]